LFTGRDPGGSETCAQWRRSPQLSIIEDGAIFVRGDRIEAVGRRREVESLITGDCEVVDARQRVVMPALSMPTPTPSLPESVPMNLNSARVARRIAKCCARRRHQIDCAGHPQCVFDDLVKAGQRLCAMVSALWDDDDRSQIRIRSDH